MKKKILAVVLSSMMALGLAACGGTASSTTTSKKTETSSATSATASTENSKAESSESTTSVESTTSSESTQSVESSDVSEPEGQEVATGVEDNILTVGFDAEYPPYGYMDADGNYTGFDLELAEAVCELEGWQLEKKPINWDAKDMELSSGAIDCIWNGFTINGREDSYTFSIPYVDNSQVIVVAADSGIEKLADLAGKVVGVQAASAALELLESEEEGGQKELAATFASLNQFNDYNTAFTELQAGALDALAIDIGVAKYQINSRGKGFVILDENLNSEQYGVGCLKGNTYLADLISSDLLLLAKNGTVGELAEKYEISDMVSLKVE